jgi:hypothetical protein
MNSLVVTFTLHLYGNCHETDLNMLGKGKVILLHAIEVHGLTGGIAPTHS